MDSQGQHLSQNSLSSALTMRFRNTLMYCNGLLTKVPVKGINRENHRFKRFVQVCCWDTFNFKNQKDKNQPQCVSAVSCWLEAVYLSVVNDQVGLGQKRMYIISFLLNSRSQTQIMITLHCKRKTDVCLSRAEIQTFINIFTACMWDYCYV